MFENFAQENPLEEQTLPLDQDHIYNSDPAACQAAHSILNSYLSEKSLSDQDGYCDNPGKGSCRKKKYVLQKYYARPFSHRQKKILPAQAEFSSFRSLL